MGKRDREETGFSRAFLAHAAEADGLHYIAEHARRISGAERCSIFVYDRTEDQLWTTLSDGTEKIIIPYDIGIVGQTIRVQKPQLENEPYDNPNFLADVDMQTGYYTQNILTAPILNARKEIIGALQLLNKEEGFTKKDVAAMSAFVEEISPFIAKTGTPQE